MHTEKISTWLSYFLVGVLAAPFLVGCNLSDSFEANLGQIGNLCGGEEDLFFNNAVATPGEPCGPCGDGVLSCDGRDRLRCQASSQRNECGGCEPLLEEQAPSSPCGSCGDGVWVCDEGGIVCQGASIPNSCGGCTALSEEPGDDCEVDAEDALFLQFREVREGVYSCVGPEQLRCVLAGQNACGGSAELEQTPGSACGSCGQGIWQCDGTEGLFCAGEQQGINACGGCAPLAGSPGGACGRCNGEFICEGTERVICNERSRNSCGTCDDLGGNQPGETCGPNSLFVCFEEGLSCQRGARNPCGGQGELESLPGESCGACNTGYVICTSPESTFCVGAAEENLCGGCALLPANPGTSCGVSGSWACESDDQVGCAEAPVRGEATIDAPSGFIADGEMIAPLNIVLRDSLGEPLVGVTPRIEISGENYTFYPCSPTNRSGHSRCGLSSQEAGTREVSMVWPLSASTDLRFEHPWPYLNGTVLTVLQTEELTMLGGNFQFTGEPSGSFIRVNSSGEAAAIGPVIGAVRAIQPDGMGGYYVAGGISHVGGAPTERLVHLDASGGLMSPVELQFNGIINSLALYNDRLYIGGSFSQVNGEDRGRFVAMDTGSGELLDVDFRVNSTVTALQLQGDILYLVGAFSEVLGSPRGRGASINLSNHSLQPWNPRANSSIQALIVEGNRILLGGGFSAIGAGSSRGLAMVDALAGELTAPSFPSVGFGITTLATSPEYIYVGGSFPSVGEDSIPRLTRFRRSNGTLDRSWRPTPSATVSAMYWHDDHLLVGGSFVGMGTGEDRVDAYHIATFNDQGELVAPPVETTGAVLAFATQDDELLIGGSFEAIHPLQRRSLLILDRETGEVLDTSGLAVIGSITSLALRDESVAVGGSFFSVNDEARPGIAHFAIPSFELLERAPIDVELSDGRPAIPETGYVDDDGYYIGGYFFTANEKARSSIAQLDREFTVTPWIAEVPTESAQGVIYHLFSAGPLIGAQGFLTAPSGQFVEVVLLDGETGRAVSMAHDPLIEYAEFGWGNGWDMDESGKLYMAGQFYGGGQTFHLMSYETGEGMQSIDLQVNNLNGVAVIDEEHLLLIGAFSEIQGESKEQFAVVTRDEELTVNLSWYIPPQLSIWGARVLGNTILLHGHAFSPAGNRIQNRMIPKPGLYP